MAITERSEMGLYEPTFMSLLGFWYVVYYVFQFPWVWNYAV